MNVAGKGGWLREKMVVAALRTYAHVPLAPLTSSLPASSSLQSSSPPCGLNQDRSVDRTATTSEAATRTKRMGHTIFWGASEECVSVS
jgi:hypothetical protein